MACSVDITSELGFVHTRHASQKPFWKMAPVCPHTRDLAHSHHQCAVCHPHAIPLQLATKRRKVFQQRQECFRRAWITPPPAFPNR